MARVPKYEKVTEWILGRIQSGELKDGMRLEPEQEISKLFGISRQTVRQALEVVEREGYLERRQGSGTYVRYAQARPRRELSSTVTIISTYVDGYIFPRILKSMVRVLEESGYDANIVFSNNHLETERQLLIRLLREQNGNPVIAEPVMSGLPSPNLKYYRQLHSEGVPVLFFHSFYPDLNIPHVSMNDEEAGYMATHYLIEHGHRDIAGIFKADDGQGRRRYQGYLRALLESEIPIKERRVCWIDTQEMKDFPTMRSKLLERLHGCTACVCYNDEVAHELTGFLMTEGVRIPEEMSLTSIDNSELAGLNAIPLTSVSNPMERLGECAAQHMIRLIRDANYQATYEFPVEIQERSSVRELRKV
ncbi:MAG: GntR family transcriptional regulator [Eubacteriales bacterium]|nr:GntR family transcriptional regulator [Eubacteriales bacterium]